MSLGDRIFTFKSLSEKYPELTPTYRYQENKRGGGKQSNLCTLQEHMKLTHAHTHPHI